MKTYLASLLFALLTVSAVSAQSADDTPATRQKEAERYLQATPSKALIEDMVKKIAVTIPAEQREKFIQTLTSQLDFDALRHIKEEALVKHFTTAELKALADFYGSPVGKSAMSKFGEYMAEMMPPIQEEVKKAYKKASEAEAK